jgi:hypothetical protein
MTDGEYATAMQAIASSPHLQKYVNISLGNLIRRHLYVKDMAESNWYLGAIAMLRKLQKDSEEWKSHSDVTEGEK